MRKTLWRQSWSSLLWVLLSGCIYGKRIKSNPTMGGFRKGAAPLTYPSQIERKGDHEQVYEISACG